MKIPLLVSFLVIALSCAAAPDEKPIVWVANLSKTASVVKTQAILGKSVSGRHGLSQLLPNQKIPIYVDEFAPGMMARVVVEATVGGVLCVQEFDFRRDQGVWKLVTPRGLVKVDAVSVTQDQLDIMAASHRQLARLLKK